MPNKYKNLFSIIKTALTNASACLDNALDIEALFNLSKKHQIIPLVFQGLYKAKGDFEGSEKFKSHTIRLLCHDQNQLYCISQIEHAFIQNGVDYMLLKGASVKRLYPSSELRLMGDIDILIKEEQYETIRTILPQMGFRETKETDHERMWQTDTGILIELHKRLIPSYNDDYYAYYKKAWEKARPVPEKPHCFAMAPEDEYIYLFTHLAKHYRDGGIGLRHVLDIWWFRRQNPNLNMAYLSRELKKLKLERFHQNILNTVEVWFNAQEDSELTAHITERIIESGAYGLKENCDAANAARISAGAASVTGAKIQKIFSLIFMPYSDMKKKYAVLNQAPILLPVMWVVRWIDALAHKQRNISRQSERLNKINAKVVADYNKELEMVGLQFNLSKHKH